MEVKKPRNYVDSALFSLTARDLRLILKLKSKNMSASASHLTQRRHHGTFNLQRMDELYVRMNGKPDVPHRHAYYTVLLIKKAAGKHVVDYQTHFFGEKQVHFVSPGQVHQVQNPERPEGWVVTFSKDFLVENNIPESFISNLNLFRQFGDSPPLSVNDETFEKLARIMGEMEEIVSKDLHYSSRALGSLLQLFLIYCSNGCNLDAAQLDEENSGVCILRDFKNSVERHFHEWHKVSDYVTEIPVSSKHLSYTVKTLTGKTAKELIQDRLTLEAKRLLLHTELNIKEIGYKIGFEEPLHFSGFFKKQTGQSPTDFRLK
jgi:AraC family transcriptional regulator, transcriptional activator of pobA